jgi:magnesium chelatase family protein
MKTSSTNSFALTREGCVLITVEVAIRPGLPLIELQAGKVSQSSVRSLIHAAQASGFTWPKGKIYIKVSENQCLLQQLPELAIVVAILQADKQLAYLENIVYLGKVSLLGRVDSFQHIGLLEEAARLTGFQVVSPGCGMPKSLYLKNLKNLTVLQDALNAGTQNELVQKDYLFDKVLGQSAAKRAVCISLIGKLPLLLTGLSGMGKTLLGKGAAQLLPFPTTDLAHAQQVKRVLAANDTSERRSVTPPIGTTVSSLTTLYGNLPGGYLKLAEQEVLFLDELPEWGKDTVDLLRQLLEISPESDSHTQRIIAAQNTCPCGRFGLAHAACACTPHEVAKYQKTFSEAMYQRFPLSVFVGTPIKDKDIPAQSYAKKVAAALSLTTTPSLDQQAKTLLSNLARDKNLSPRVVANLERVGKAIAKLESAMFVSSDMLEEALSYRYIPTFI